MSTERDVNFRPLSKRSLRNKPFIKHWIIIQVFFSLDVQFTPDGCEHEETHSNKYALIVNKMYCTNWVEYFRLGSKHLFP